MMKILTPFLFVGFVALIGISLASNYFPSIKSRRQKVTDQLIRGNEIKKMETEMRLCFYDDDCSQDVDCNTQGRNKYYLGPHSMTEKLCPREVKYISTCKENACMINVY